MKKSELVLMLLYIVFTAVVAETTLCGYTPKLCCGGFILVAFVLASCVLREKSGNLNDEEKSLQYNRLAFAFQVISWLLFAFYLAMVLVGF